MKRQAKDGEKNTCKSKCDKDPTDEANYRTKEL